MQIPKTTAIEPYTRYGTISLVLLSMKEMRTPGLLLLYTFSASFKFAERALRIGMIELKKGIKTPTKSALATAVPEGVTVGK